MKEEKSKKDSKKKKRLKDKIKVTSNNEKQYSITLKGYEKAKAEELDIAGIKAERLGIKYASEKVKDPKILELKSDITYYENKIHEKQLELRAFLNEVDKLKEELAKINSYENLKKKVIKEVLPVYNDFLKTGSSDLTDFYKFGTNFHDRLDIIRMKNNLKKFEDIVEIFEEYLKELEEKTALDSSNDATAKE